MDLERFDALARFVWARTTRRAALGGLFGGLLAGMTPDALEAGKNQKHKRRRKRRRRHRRRRRKRRACFPSKSKHCQPGPGQDSARCDFAHSQGLFERDMENANLSQANFSGAEMAGANLVGASLEGACLVGANLLDAAIDETTNLDGAIFCRTLMPDGSTNDRDCGKGTRCCPTPDPICKTCSGSDCITTPETVCSIFGTPCCPGMACTATAEIALTTCQAPCDTDDDCVKLFGGGVKCCSNQALLCPFFPGGRCCQHPGPLTCE